MPATEHLVSDTVRCFLLTDMRIIEAHPRSVVIDSLSRRDVTAITAPRPKPGSLIQLYFGDQGWVDAVVRWTDDEHLGLRLQHDIEADPLFENESSGLPAAPKTRVA